MNFIQFYYLYRDSRNQRRYRCAVFTNPAFRSQEEIDLIIRENLHDDTWFDHSEWGLPAVHESEENNGDHHEYVGVIATSEMPLGPAIMSVEDLLQKIRNGK